MASVFVFYTYAHTDGWTDEHTNTTRRNNIDSLGPLPLVLHYSARPSAPTVAYPTCCTSGRYNYVCLHLLCFIRFHMCAALQLHVRSCSM